MINTPYKTTKSLIYKKVYRIVYSTGTVKWKAIHQITLATRKISKAAYFDTEREAAISVDKFLLKHNKNAINILIKKSE